MPYGVLVYIYINASNNENILSIHTVHVRTTVPYS